MTKIKCKFCDNIEEFPCTQDYMKTYCKNYKTKFMISTILIIAGLILIAGWSLYNRNDNESHAGVETNTDNDNILLTSKVEFLLHAEDEKQLIEDIKRMRK